MRANNKMGPPADNEPQIFRLEEAKGLPSCGGPDEPADDSQLVLEIEVPDDASPGEILRTVRELHHGADESHKALGGHGLVISHVEWPEGMTLPPEPNKGKKPNK